MWLIPQRSTWLESGFGITAQMVIFQGEGQFESVIILRVFAVPSE